MRASIPQVAERCDGRPRGRAGAHAPRLRFRRLCSLLLALLLLGLHGAGEALHHRLHPAAGRSPVAVSRSCERPPILAGAAVAVTDLSDAACALCALSHTPALAGAAPAGLSFAPPPDAPGTPGWARAPGAARPAPLQRPGRSPPSCAI